MVIIDLHCHIDLYDNPSAVLERAEKAGIYVLSVTTTPKAWAGTNQISRKHKRVRTALGLHPQLVHQRSGELSLFERLLPEVNYVGEIGLDNGKNYKQHFSQQIEVFEKIVSLVKQSGGKIMSIHSTHAVDEVLDTLEKNPDSGPPILHWFTGNYSQLDRAVDLGCWFSVGPKMMESNKGRGLISRMPLDKILLETDGPFARASNGRPFEPKDTLRLMQRLPACLNLQDRDLRSVIIKNFRNLTSFNLHHN